MIYSKLMVPIVAPIQLSRIKAQPQPKTFFFKQQIYTFYTWQNYQFVQDNERQWYIILDYECQSLTELKATRQIQRPHYLQQATLPTIDLLQALNVQVDSVNFDKAYGHALYFSENIQSITDAYKLKIANFDGEDDPQVTKAFHYVESIYNDERTQFIAGVETYSFATITESPYYAEHIWQKETGLLYLLLFAYFKRYRVCPSEQMLPKLLCNLWASTEIMNPNINHSLYFAKELN